MESPHEPADPLPDLIEQVRAARVECDRAGQALRAYADDAQLDEERRRQIEDVLGPQRPHQRRRWGAAPS